MRVCVCACTFACARVSGDVGVCMWACVRARMYVGVCAWVCACACARVSGDVDVCARACGCVHGCMRVGMWKCVRACVRAFVCVSYLYSLLTLIRKPTLHRLSGSVFHFTPIVNKNIGSRCFSLCLYYSLEYRSMIPSI